MTHFPQPTARLQALSVYANRMRVIGIKATVVQMLQDGRTDSDVRTCLYSAGFVLRK